MKGDYFLASIAILVFLIVLNKGLSLPALETSSNIKQRLTKSRWLSLLIPMASIGSLLFALIGLLMNLSFHAIENMAEKEVEERMLVSISQMTQKLTSELQQLERLGDLLAQQTKLLLNAPNISTPTTLAKELQHSPEGAVFGQTTNQPVIFLPFKSQQNQDNKERKLQQLALLSPLIKSIYTSHDLINRVYINTSEAETLIYPYPDLTGFFPVSSSIKGLDYYKLSKDIDTSQNAAIWRSNYKENTNKSKTLTLINPIIHQGELTGVSGLDISLDSLGQYLTKMSVPWGGYSLLMDAEGKLLVLPYQAIADWQNMNASDLLDKLGPLRSDASGLVNLKVSEQNLLLSWSSVSPTGWKLLNVANLDKAYSVKNQLIDDYKLVLYLVSVFLVFMFFLLIYLVFRRDKQFELADQNSFLIKETNKPAVIKKNLDELDFFSLITGPLIVCKFDKDGLILACNSAFEHLAGSTQNNLKGRHLFDLLDIKRSLVTSEVKEVELSVAQQGKTCFWISLHYSPTGQGLLLLLDISESKQIQQQLRGERQRARLAAKMKAEFFQVAVSDANELLLELLQNARGFDDELTNYCQAKLIEMQHLLDNMRDMSDAGELDQQDLSEDTLVLSSLVNDCYTANEGSLAKSGRRLLIEYGSNIPEFLVIDRRRLFRLMRHLLRQMIQLSGKGDIHLWFGWNTLGRLQLKIQDQGGGLDEKERLRRFQLTTPLSSSYVASSGALGLGQLLTRQLVHEMQGSLDVEAISAGGLQIQIELPAKLGKQSERLTLGRLLVVDDGPVNAMLASSVLEKSGYEVDVASSGAEALVLGKQKNYDLVLMDIFMPVMDGIETTRLWRELNNTNAKVPIIALTANAMDLEYERFLTQGIDDYLTKPYRPNELRELVQSWLEKK